MVESTIRKNRNPYWQMMRAIAIIAVIYIHSTSLGINESLISLNGLWY